MTIFVLTVVAALGSGLIAGVFFAFSTFVMQALARLPAAQGAEAMQWINRTVINVWFLGAFMGTAVVGAVLIGRAAWWWDGRHSAYLLAGGVLYVVGTFLVTGTVNVPLNERLAKVDASTDAGAELWARYQARWTRWNHVRTVAALGAALLFTLALT